jgi:hypothetical protein
MYYNIVHIWFTIFFPKPIFISGNVVQRRKTHKQCKSKDSDEELDDISYKELDTNEKPTG